MDKQRVEYAGHRLNQDLQLGQEQIAQVRANTSLALEQVRKQSLENGILEALSRNSPSWLNPKDTSGFANGMRALGWMANSFKAPDVYDERLPAIGQNVRR